MGAAPTDAPGTGKARHGLAASFRFAFAGIARTVRFERNMRIHLCVAALAIVLGAVLRIEAWAWCAVVICIAAVLAAECFNTALEAAVDLATEEVQPLARIAKDCAAGAVAVLAVGSVVVALIVFIPPALALLP